MVKLKVTRKEIANLLIDFIQVLSCCFILFPFATMLLKGSVINVKLCLNETIQTLSLPYDPFTYLSTMYYGCLLTSLNVFRQSLRYSYPPVLLLHSNYPFRIVVSLPVAVDRSLVLQYFFVVEKKISFAVQDLLECGSGYNMVIALDPNVFLVSHVRRVVARIERSHVVDDSVQ